VDFRSGRAGAGAGNGNDRSYLGLRGFLPILDTRRRCTMTAEEQQPIACTLSGEARQDRRAWIAALVRDALRGSERNDLTLRLRFAPEVVQHIRDMVRKEQACCGFLTFEMDERPQDIWLTIRAPEAARAAADELFAQFIASTGSLP
jgi:hypothetical protein